MIKELTKKILIALATMSRKVAAIYCVILSIVFFASASILLSGLILLEPSGVSSLSLTLTIVGAVLLFLVTFTLMLTTVSSNYVEKHLKEEAEQRKALKQQLKEEKINSEKNS